MPPNKKIQGPSDRQHFLLETYSASQITLYFFFSIFICPSHRCGRVQGKSSPLVIKEFVSREFISISANFWWDSCLGYATSGTHAGGKSHTTKMGSLAAAWGRTLVPFRKEWAKLWRFSIGEFRAPSGLLKPSSAFLWAGKSIIK